MLKYSRIWNVLPGMFASSATVAIVFSLPALAKTPDEIYETAQPRTVLIQSEGGGGSGVILSRQGNTYLVLTNDHVACVESPSPKFRCKDSVDYTITTHDGKKHRSTVKPVFFDAQKGDPDLALVSFESSDGYPVAILGDSEQVKIGSSIYVYGFPAYADDSGQIQQEPQFSPGNITGKSKPSRGYALSYSAVTWSGMSGAPVFDSEGRVIAIHGSYRSITVPRVYQKNQSGQFVSVGWVDVKTGFNLAIPISTFVALASKAGLNNSAFTVANAPNRSKQPNLVNPQKAEDFYVRGLTLADAGDKEGAIKDFNTSLALDPKIADTYFSRGLVLNNLGDYKGAVDNYTQAIRLNPKLAIAYNNRGLAQAALGNLQSAIEDYNQAINLEPKLAIAYNNRGLARTDLVDFKRAIEDFNQAIRLNSKLAIFHYNRGLVFANSSDFKNAIADFNQSIILDPKFAPAYSDRGATIASRGVIRGNSGDLQGATDDLRTAIKDYDQAILNSPTYFLAYYNRCDARLKLGDFKGAMGDCDQAIRLNPKFARAYNNRAIARTQLGDQKGAMEDYQKAANIFLEQSNNKEYQAALDAMKKLQPQ